MQETETETETETEPMTTAIAGKRKRKTPPTHQAAVLYSIAFNYATIIEIAKEVAAKEHWQEITCVQNLEFSNKWVSNFLERANCRRRKTFELEESNFADMVLLDDDYEDSGSDSDDDNELINAAIDEF